MSRLSDSIFCQIPPPPTRDCQLRGTQGVLEVVVSLKKNTCHPSPAGLSESSFHWVLCRARVPSSRCVPRGPRGGGEVVDEFSSTAVFRCLLFVPCLLSMSVCAAASAPP